MAEKRGVSWVLTVYLVLGVLVRSTSQAPLDPIANEVRKYGICFATCLSKSGTTPESCIRECSPKSRVDTVKDTHFCNLGCASTLCSKLSTKENPATKEVESCVNGCSARFAKKN